jgi:hypothetical protein
VSTTSERARTEPALRRSRVSTEPHHYCIGGVAERSNAAVLKNTAYQCTELHAPALARQHGTRVHPRAASCGGAATTTAATKRHAKRRTGLNTRPPPASACAMAGDTFCGEPTLTAAMIDCCGAVVISAAAVRDRLYGSGVLCRRSQLEERCEAGRPREARRRRAVAPLRRRSNTRRRAGGHRNPGALAQRRRAGCLRNSALRRLRDVRDSGSASRSARPRSA